MHRPEGRDTDAERGCRTRPKPGQTFSRLKVCLVHITYDLTGRYPNLRIGDLVTTPWPRGARQWPRRQGVVGRGEDYQA
jgi:hypothetical protein